MITETSPAPPCAQHGAPRCTPPIGYLLACVLGVTLVLSACHTPQPQPVASVEASSPLRTLIIHYHDSADNRQRIINAAAGQNAEIVYLLDRLSMVVVRLAEGRSVDEGIAVFSRMPGVIAVERDQVQSLH